MKKIYGTYYYDCIDVLSGEKYTLIMTGEASVANFETGETIPPYSQALENKETGKLMAKPYYIAIQKTWIKCKNGYTCCMNPGDLIITENGFKVAAEYSEKPNRFR